MIDVRGSHDEPITLRFHGGFLHPVPGIGKPRGMEAHFRFPDGVSVRAKGPTGPLERLLTAAVRVDFLSDEDLRLEPKALARRLSHILPIDHHGFRKTIGFKGGAVAGCIDGGLLETRRSELERLLASGTKSDAFTTLTRIRDHHGDYLRDLSEEFCRQADEEKDGLAPWLDGYCIEVKLRPARVLVNGLIPGEHESAGGEAVRLPPGAVIEFRAIPGSHVPHYPADNPHVLEQPPTI